MVDEKNVELDTKEVDANIEEEEKEKVISRAEQKVELDLDDAPFLEELEEEKEEKGPPEAKEKSETQPKEIEEKKEQKEEESKKKKKLIIIIASGLSLLLIAGALYFFLTPKKEEKPPPPPKEVKVQEKPPPPKPEIIQYSFRPFWVDYDLKNEHKYLHLTLTIEYTEKRINWELLQKNIVIRDAIYYYLKNKDINFFLDKKNIPTLKQDLMSIINQYLGYGKVNAIYLKDFLIE